MDFLSSIKQKAKILQKHIIFAEGFEPRTLQALELVLKEETALPIVIGEIDELKKTAEAFHLALDWGKIEVISLNDKKHLDRYAEALFQRRKEKGITLEYAYELLKNHDYFGVMAVQTGDADGMISGASGPTADTVRPALEIIKTKEKFHKVSGVFFMIWEKRLLLFADCAVNIEPNSHDLADIAIDTAETARRFGIEPNIAMLSFSTHGSAKHPLVDKVREATELVRYRRPELTIEGEMQVDAALVPEICTRKFPGSKVPGNANILIFPDLQAANIAYKLVERLGGAEAIGPLLQGLCKPVNDLSRGCSFHDIADMTAFTACETEEIRYDFHGTAMTEFICNRPRFNH